MPIMALLAVATPFGPILKWQRCDFSAVLRALRVAAIAGLAAAVLAAALAPASLTGVLAVGLGVWMIAGATTYVARRVKTWRDLKMSPGAWGMTLSHAGLGVVALGIAGATVWKSESIEVLSPGQSMDVAGYTLRLERTDRVQGPNYLADRATIGVSANGKSISTMQPEKRAFPVEGQVVSKTAIRTTGWADLYLALGDEREKGSWVVRAYSNPLAPFIWLGAGLTALGGLFSFRARLRTARAYVRDAS
jgi:cytochrome c-type biogenesis protein CcmF